MVRAHMYAENVVTSQTLALVFSSVHSLDSLRCQVWSASAGRLLLTLRGHSSVITDLAVSPDNSLLASSSEDRNIRIWDPRTGASLAVLRGHGLLVNLIRFAPAESILASASEDGTCRVWDLRDRARFVDQLVQKESSVVLIENPVVMKS